MFGNFHGGGGDLVAATKAGWFVQSGADCVAEEVRHFECHWEMWTSLTITEYREYTVFFALVTKEFHSWEAKPASKDQKVVVISFANLKQQQLQEQR